MQSIVDLSSLEKDETDVRVRIRAAEEEQAQLMASLRSTYQSYLQSIQNLHRLNSQHLNISQQHEKTAKSQAKLSETYRKLLELLQRCKAVKDFNKNDLIPKWDTFFEQFEARYAEWEPKQILFWFQCVIVGFNNNNNNNNDSCDGVDWHAVETVLHVGSYDGLDLGRINSDQKLKKLKFNNQKHRHMIMTAIDNLLGKKRNDEVVDARLCKVCVTNEINIVLLPCNHACICQQCYDRLSAPRKCPLCRKPVAQTNPIHFG